MPRFAPWDESKERISECGRTETIKSSGSESILPGFAAEVRGVVGTAGSLEDSSLRVWAEGAGHVDVSAFVDSSGGDGFGGFVLFEPTFERGEGVELIGACAAAAMGHSGDHKETKPVVLIRAHEFQ